MPNSRQSSAIGSPASRRATNCNLSSITEHSFQGIIPSPLRRESVTHVSGTKCHPCLRPLTQFYGNTLQLPKENPCDRGAEICYAPNAYQMIGLVNKNGAEPS